MESNYLVLLIYIDPKMECKFSKDKKKLNSVYQKNISSKVQEQNLSNKVSQTFSLNTFGDIINLGFKIKYIHTVVYDIYIYIYIYIYGLKYTSDCVIYIYIYIYTTAYSL